MRGPPRHQSRSLCPHHCPLIPSSRENQREKAFSLVLWLLYCTHFHWTIQPKINVSYLGLSPFVKIASVLFFLILAETFKLLLTVWLAEQKSQLRSDKLGFETWSLLADISSIILLVIFLNRWHYTCSLSIITIYHHNSVLSEKSEFKYCIKSWQQCPFCTQECQYIVFLGIGQLQQLRCSRYQWQVKSCTFWIIHCSDHHTRATIKKVKKGTQWIFWHLVVLQIYFSIRPWVCMGDIQSTMDG